MITIGIDPSLNSTGVCVNIDGKCDYYIVTSKMTKKMKEFKHDSVHYLPYEKQDTNKKENDYQTVERHKAHNVYNICKNIRKIIEETYAKHNEKMLIFMEGVSYGSLGSAALVDLSGLNFAIRNILLSLPYTDFVIVSPTQNKKFATGNGSADKDLMVFSWKKIETHIADITEIKTDDLADAYFLSNYYKALNVS